MKQSSIEWLFEELFNSFEKFSNGDFSLSEYMTHNLILRKQAKAMHKEEIIDAWIATDNELQRMAAEQYYNETFKSE